MYFIQCRWLDVREDIILMSVLLRMSRVVHLVLKKVFKLKEIKLTVITFLKLPHKLVMIE